MRLAESVAETMIASMKTDVTAEFAELARKLAGDAANIARSYLGRPETRRKADASVVTDADHAVQAHILAAISARFPDHGVCAEETVSEPEAHADAQTARFCWVIDPIDGTRNFVAGFPFFATSIAVLDAGRPVVGVVAEHNLGLTYVATRGAGAMLNGCPIHAVDPPAGSDLLLGIPSSKDRLTVDTVRTWVATRGFVLRNTGSTSVHLAMVAAGTIAGAFAKQCKIWDIAAGVLLIQEAGGVVTDALGDDLLPFDMQADFNADIPFLAASPTLHTRLLATLPADGK